MVEWGIDGQAPRASGGGSLGRLRARSHRVDWTQSHHDRGPQIYRVKEAYDYVEDRYGLFQTVVTAAISNHRLIDGLAVEVQMPNFSEEELEYLCVTNQDAYTEMEAVRQRIMELLSYHRNRQAYRKRTEIAVEVVRQIESEGQFPQADYAFNNGGLTLELTCLIEGHGKHWGEIECSWHINWQGQWRRVAEVGEELRR